MTDLDEDRDRTGEVLRRMAPKRERILQRRDAWYEDPWDDPEMVDALAVERPRRSSRRGKLVVFLVGAIAIAGVLVAGGVGLWYIGKVNPQGDAGAARSFTVEANDTLETVSARLKEQGFISDAGVFRWYVDHHDGLELTPGYYQIRPDDHMGNVMLALNTPPSATYQQVTFPEGYTIDKMATRLNSRMPRLSVGDFVGAATNGTVTSEYLPEGQTSLEGLLFPDTYQVSNAETATQVVNRMVKLMERVGTQEDLVRRAYEMQMSAYQVLIVASMIEREAKFDSDRPKIARVIYNRLKLDMPLQIDATLYYGQDQDASFSDLRALDTPYNTYLHEGLPPTPIANPGRASIEAALNPSPDPGQGDPVCAGIAPGECHYLYYVKSDKEGHHVFAATLEQHDANVAAAQAAGVLG